MSASPQIIESPKSIVNSPKSICKLDIGCGSNKAKDHIGMDAIAFEGVDVVHDLRETPWPFEDNSVEAANCSHVLEHLTNFNGKWERVRFWNELWRVMVPVEYNSAGAPVKGVARVVIPHWASNRYYGDPTHCEPMSEFAICYLDPEWRKNNAPHTDIKHNPNGYNCHWAVSYDYTLHQDLAGKNEAYLRWALTFSKEAAQDLLLTCACIKK